MSPRPEERDDVADVVTQLRYPPSLKRVADEAFEVSRNDLRILLQARTKGANLIERQAAELAALRSERAALPVCPEHEAELADLPVACVVCEREQMAARVARFVDWADRAHDALEYNAPNHPCVDEYHELRAALSEYRGDERMERITKALRELRRSADVVHLSVGAEGHDGAWYCSASRKGPPPLSTHAIGDGPHEVTGNVLAAVRAWPPRPTPAGEPGPANPADPSPREEP